MKKQKKITIEDKIRELKNDPTNKEAIKSENIDPSFVVNYFKTLLINFPNDSTWMHNISNNKFSCISHSEWSHISDAPTKYNEIISINMLEQQDGEPDWIDEDTKREYDKLNVIIDASKCLNHDDLVQLVRKYLPVAMQIAGKNFYPIQQKFGKDFVSNIKHEIKDNIDSDKDLKVNVYFININDDNVDVEKFRTLFHKDNKNYIGEDIVIDGSTTAFFYGNEDLLNLFNQCENCQWPYVNATERLVLTNPEVCRYKVPKQDLTGYLCNISAFSLATLYRRYKNGLFSGNIRYFIKKGKGAKDVNVGIRATIHDDNKRGLFYFYNNGITFITPSLKIKGKELILDKFSIVNGGQTTYIIGTEKLEEDFTIPCKILEIKCDVSRELQTKNETKYKENLAIWLTHAGDISYALNSQKPVAKKDLISNRTSIRKLKEHYQRTSNGSVILLTKAGEDTFLPADMKAKSITLETYLNLIFCFFLQMPGFAKNQKAKMFNDGNIKKVVGDDKDRDCKKFFSPSQLIQVNYAKKIIDKRINAFGRALKANPDQYTIDQVNQIALLKYCKNIVLSLCGLAHFYALDMGLFNYYVSPLGFMQECFNKCMNNVDLSKPIFLDEGLTSNIVWDDLITSLLEEIIWPGYKKWSADQISSGVTDVTPRMFSMKDETFHSYVVKEFKNLLDTKEGKWFSIFADLIDFYKD